LRRFLPPFFAFFAFLTGFLAFFTFLFAMFFIDPAPLKDEALFIFIK